MFHCTDDLGLKETILLKSSSVTEIFLDTFKIFFIVITSSRRPGTGGAGGAAVPPIFSEELCFTSSFLTFLKVDKFRNLSFVFFLLTQLLNNIIC